MIRRLLLLVTLAVLGLPPVDAIAADPKPSVVRKRPPAKKPDAKKPDAKEPDAPAPKTAWRCSLCHTTASWTSIPKRIKFDHRQTGVPLYGAHEKAPCVGCHKPHSRQKTGAATVARACLSCHQDQHRGELGNRCEDCHTTSTWAAPRRFPKHDASRFSLTGAHTFVACRSCHTTRGRDTYRGTPATCDACHRKDADAATWFPHRKVAAPCNQCHSTFSWAPARVDHTIWWPLVGSHAEVSSCTSKCHTTGRFSDQSRYCASCHGTMAEWASPDHKALGFGDDCSKCHQPFRWSALNHTFHEQWFTLTSGPHRRYLGSGKCGSCHGPGIGGGKFECVGCHDGAHEQKRTEALHANIGGFTYKNAACKGCHPMGKF